MSWKIAVRHTCAFAGTVLLTAPASALPGGFFINAEGSGIVGATPVSRLNFAGTGFIRQALDPADGSSFVFVENGVYALEPAPAQAQTQSMTPSTGHEITLTYSTFGGGQLAAPLSLGFYGGTIDLFSDPAVDYGSTQGIFGADNGKHVARFLITAGGNDFSAPGAPASNATVWLRAMAQSITPGYLFDGDGHDLGVGASLTISVNSGPGLAADNLVQEIVCEQGAFAGPGCIPGLPAYENLFPAYYLVSDFATAALAPAPIPEPGSLALLLGGLLGLNGIRLTRARYSDTQTAPR